jgi:hypothetical protein
VTETPSQIARYADLVSAWTRSSASSGALPLDAAGNSKSLYGVTGIQNKIDIVNKWTITKPLPADVSMSDIVNATAINDFNNLTSSQYLSLQTLFIGGSVTANPNSTARASILTAFANFPQSVTGINNLFSTFDNAQSSWLDAHGISGNLTIDDINVTSLT